MELGQRAKETARIGMGRIAEDGANAAGFHEAAGIEHANAVADARNGAKVVGDEQDRGAELAAQVTHQFEDRGLDRHVEPRCRLVHDEQRGFGHQRHGDDDALLLAAGEFVRIARQHPLGIGQADLAEHGDGARTGGGLARLTMQQRHLDELPPDGDDGVQAAHRVLVDHRDPVSAHGAQRSVIEGREVAPVEHDAAGGDAHAARQVAQGSQSGGRLAATGLADEPERLAGSDRQREIVNDAHPPGAVGVFDGDVLETQHVSHRGTPHGCLSRGS